MSTKHEIAVYLEGLQVGVATAIHTIVPSMPEATREALIKGMVDKIAGSDLAKAAIHQRIDTLCAEFGGAS